MHRNKQYCTKHSPEHSTQHNTEHNIPHNAEHDTQHSTHHNTDHSTQHSTEHNTQHSTEHNAHHHSLTLYPLLVTFPLLDIKVIDRSPLTSSPNVYLLIKSKTISKLEQHLTSNKIKIQRMLQGSIYSASNYFVVYKMLNLCTFIAIICCMLNY